MTRLPDERSNLLARIRAGRAENRPPVHGLFEQGAPLHLARAPARLDLMGGIADYSGSLVLEWPLAESVVVAAQRIEAPTLRAVSLPNSDRTESLAATLALGDLAGLQNDALYAAVAARFPPGHMDHWAAYVLGVFPVLMRRAGWPCDTGCALLIQSNVPEGKGVASSAALEVAVMRAVGSACGIKLDPVEMSLWCQEVENRLAGAPCGVMDQVTAACGEAGRLLTLLCQPAELLGQTPLPEPLRVWGLDAGERHCVAGADYGSVRTGAFMGYRMLAGNAGMAVHPVAPGRVRVDDTKWGGYLANVGARTFERHLRKQLPVRMSGADFLARWQGITDEVTRIDPAREYAVAAPTAHPVFEHARVERFRELLQGSPSSGVCRELGQLMFASHQSYAACGITSPGTDRLVRLVAELGAGRGLFGAKITGGGSGGTVAVLGDADGEEALARVIERYAGETGHRPHLFQGSSPGAFEAGVWAEAPA